MPLGPDPERARAALAQLDALRDAVAAAEDDLLACLVVTGEPRPQRVLDDWLDQAADTLRALGEQAADLSPSLARFAVEPRSPAASPDAVPPTAPSPDASAPPRRARMPWRTPRPARMPSTSRAVRPWRHRPHEEGRS